MPAAIGRPCGEAGRERWTRAGAGDGAEDRDDRADRHRARWSIAFLLGPRVKVDTTVRFDPAAIGADPEAYLAGRGRGEEHPAGQQKEIVWANPATKAKTPMAIVYVHGFSASKWEVRPLPDKVAAALGANLFYTRLTGHGQDGAAMAEGSVNAWINDYAEAIAIGRAIGDKVVVIGTSTGASLATWAASQPGLREGCRDDYRDLAELRPAGGRLGSADTAMGRSSSPS